jgi:hypothetical protein
MGVDNRLGMVADLYLKGSKSKRGEIGVVFSMLPWSVETSRLSPVFPISRGMGIMSPDFLFGGVRGAGPESMARPGLRTQYTTLNSMVAN